MKIRGFNLDDPGFGDVLVEPHGKVLKGMKAS
jgi:hypothetical protein